MSNRTPYGPPWKVAGLQVLIVGLGRSGLAAARLCAREGAKVKITDRRGPGEIDTLMLSGLPIEERLGGHHVEDFTSADLIIVSPGVPLSIPELVAAREAGVTIIGEVELAWSFLSDVPLVAVTGTNGKSTTTALIGAILAADGRRPFVGGNIGRALSEAALERRAPGAIALELSSFQLDTCVHLRPDVALVLNLEPDHLDRHGSFEAYAAAKARIFRNQRNSDAAVVWGDDEQVMTLTRGIFARVHRFAEGEASERGAGFSSDASAGYSVVSLKGETGEVERYEIRSAALRGPHNAANAAAATLACRIMGAAPRSIQQALESFPGLPHRLERVRVRDGVEWINDSKATNTGSALVALRSFPGGVIWIAGGLGKGTGYESVVEAASGRVKALLAIGEDAPIIVKAAEGRLERVENVGTLDAAVARAAKISSTGDVVLLSPACASYDQFKDFEERGAAFKRLVEVLP